MSAPAKSEELGQLQLPLVTSGGNGTLYRLSAQFLITDGFGNLQVVDGSGDAMSLQVALAPGGYSVAIADGFVIERSLGGQPFQPVTATLASPRAVDVFIQQGNSTFLAFQFLVANAAADSSLTIAFGVVPQRGQLVGILLIDNATGAFRPYVEGAPPPSFAAPYAITGEGSSSFPPRHEFFTGTVGFTVTSDTVGALAAIAPSMAGGNLSFSIETRSDDSQRFDLSFTSAVTAPFSLLTIQTDDLQPTVPVTESRIPLDPVASRFRATIPFQLGGAISSDAASGRIDLQFLP